MNLRCLLPLLLFTASAFADPLVVPFPNENVFVSPNVFYPGDGSIRTSTGGAYIKGVVTGTATIKLNVDPAPNEGIPATDYPAFKVVINDGPSNFVQMASGQKQLTIATGLAPGATYKYRLDFTGGDQNDGGYTSTHSHTHVLSMEFDSGATLSAPALRSKRALIFGDSYLEGYYGDDGHGKNWYTYVDPSVTWAVAVSYALDCEFGLTGIGGTGWMNPANDFPAFTTWYKNFYNGAPNPFTVQPDYVIVAMGTNDHRGTWSGEQVQAAITAWIADLRTHVPNAKVFFLIPFGGPPGDLCNREPIKAGVAAAHDSKCYVLDPGSELAPAIPFANGKNWLTGDGLHVDREHQSYMAAMVAAKIQALLSAPAAP